MKSLLFHVFIFLLVFCSGMLFVCCCLPAMNSASSGRKALPLPEKKQGGKSYPLPPAVPETVRKLPPLALPGGIRAERCPEKSWEFSGEINSNMVSARGRLEASFCNQGWHTGKKISLDESLSPREILTFTKNKYELILMLWRISGNVTGFAYRRELQDKPIEKVIQ